MGEKKEREGGGRYFLGMRANGKQTKDTKLAAKRKLAQGGFKPQDLIERKIRTSALTDGQKSPLGQGETFGIGISPGPRVAKSKRPPTGFQVHM